MLLRGDEFRKYDLKQDEGRIIEIHIELIDICKILKDK